MSGTPRAPGGIAVLPAGSGLWYAGRENTWLKPPPVATPAAGLDQTTSACPANAPWHCAGGETLSTVRVVVLFGSVHSDVPPTPVTSGSEAGHTTVGVGIGEPPFPTGDLRSLAVPVSPEEPSTLTPLAAAALKA